MDDHHLDAAVDRKEFLRRTGALGLAGAATLGFPLLETRAAGAAPLAPARDVIAARGHGEHFGHGLGHGVGMEVHEAPRLSQRSDDTLAPGNVVTVEPGVYVPGRFGVRIEDLVLVTENGSEVLNGLSKRLLTTD